MPFAKVKRHLTVVSGMSVKTGRAGPHLYHAGALSGSEGTGKSVDLPTIDQLVAAKIAGDTPFKSLELGVCSARPTNTGALYYNISWNGPHAPNPADMDPHPGFHRRL